ncbi:hypothetical protein BESB_027800 [Besnoitia besnoiti]|uniref:Uncharacterized protein n=1 Tax=Besnoitia besnoiti TaxID=94643 RepID=A0A2A9M044_BESBE|nr:uncharacterized protein BESB_027800 [Besnoitia besnoiti]PFH31345.1 hypothetical protein BESB_027800 [Besnoitia besnoiti]
MNPHEAYRSPPPRQLGFSSCSPPIGFSNRIQVLPNLSAVEEALKGLSLRLDRVTEQTEKQLLSKPHFPDALRLELLDRVAQDNETSVNSSLPEQLNNGLDIIEHSTVDDSLERYVRIRLADSCVLRLLDYFGRHADLYETWDWEIDADLVPPELTVQTGARHFCEMLPDVVSLHTELLKINTANMKVLRRLQEKLAEEVEEAGALALELGKRYTESMLAVTEAIDLQKGIPDFDLTVLADRCLGDRTKYLVYDAKKKRLTLDARAYMKSIIPVDKESETAARELDRRIASLCWDGVAEVDKGTQHSRAGKRRAPPSEVAKKPVAPARPFMKKGTKNSRDEIKAKRSESEERSDEGVDIGVPDRQRLAQPRRVAKIE